MDKFAFSPLTGLSRREALGRLAGFTAVTAFGTISSAAFGESFADGFGDHFDAAQDGPKTEKLTDSIAVLSGVGGNIAVLTGKNGTLQVDAGNPGTMPGVKKAISALTGSAVELLVNTHWHGDHTGGNGDTAAAGARIYAHDNVRKRLSTDQFMEAFNRKVPASPEIALPVLTFGSRMTLHHNGEEIVLTHVAPAHTDGDILVHFESECAALWRPVF